MLELLIILIVKIILNCSHHYLVINFFNHDHLSIDQVHSHIPMLMLIFLDNVAPLWVSSGSTFCWVVSKASFAPIIGCDRFLRPRTIHFCMIVLEHYQEENYPNHNQDHNLNANRTHPIIWV